MICLSSIILVLVLAAIVAERHRWRTVHYVWQKIRDPNLKPPKMLKFWNRTVSYSFIIFVIGLGMVKLYPFVLAGQFVAASFVAGLIVLVVVAVVMINGYWKDHFDL